MKVFRNLFLLLALPMVQAYAHGNEGHMMDWNNNLWIGSGGFIMLILLLALIGIGAYFVIGRKKLIKHDYSEAALEILKLRYAKGEITKKEFEKMKEEIKY